MATDIYIVTKTFPKEELFAMVSQMRRAATSVSMNIAEGFGRGSDKDTIRFLYISLGSLSELDTQIILSQRFGFINADDADRLSQRVMLISKMINSLISSIKRRTGE
ncbi:MAG: four helix bundle protein [Prevotella sp.]|nr:four helix bundle protein [Prevotella sp.]MCI6511077.1 four helix bundle protein [Prevotella sp.]MCI7496200.1 four helix bundle protein [Prevotella sp.]